MSELLRYATGELKAPGKDRALARRGKDFYDDVRLKALQSEGVMALAGHIMEGLVTLDNKRQALACGDPVTNATLAEIQATAIAQAKKLQSDLTDGWKL
ncbi:hypothetical protein ACSCB1_35490 [Streptomyces europaeiscabiei]|uniref:hypothetical protein n=1 Tax=Streptomyces europaeiscabiei TaxID=146819 RepID=UPI00062845C5|nr:hypothetical protein [Streptomyces europaeiscabiei]